MKKTSLVASAGMLALSVGIANAADPVLEADPAPPEPVVEADPDLSLWYLAARLGAGFADDSEFQTLGTTVENSYDTGYNISGAFGRSFDFGGPLSLRAEAELGYTAFDIDSHNVIGVGNFSGGDAQGETSALYGLVNGYVDYDLGLIQPFLGAGIGYANLDFDNHGTTATGVVLNNDDSGLAWQVGAGAAYSFSDTLKLDVGYRYMRIEDVDLTATDGTTSGVDFSNHQVTLGIRKMF